MRERRFADEAQGERGHGDAELRGGDVGIEMRHRRLHEARPGAPLVHQLVDAGLAHTDQREFGGDEKPLSNTRTTTAIKPRYVAVTPLPSLPCGSLTPHQGEIRWNSAVPPAAHNQAICSTFRWSVIICDQDVLT
jgi:hypothetical protein